MRRRGSLHAVIGFRLAAVGEAHVVCVAGVDLRGVPPWLVRCQLAGVGDAHVVFGTGVDLRGVHHPPIRCGLAGVGDAHVVLRGRPSVCGPPQPPERLLVRRWHPDCVGDAHVVVVAGVDRRLALHAVVLRRRPGVREAYVVRVARRRSTAHGRDVRRAGVGQPHVIRTAAVV